MSVNAVIWNEDCVRGMADRLADASIDLCVTSIPFEELFQYSNKVEDIGNNGSTTDIRGGRFALNLRFFVGQLYRVLRPGTNACIHIQQLLAFKNQHGFIGRRDFRGAMVDVFGAEGFVYAGEFAIQKDPQLMAMRLNLLSLQFKTGYARSATMLAPCPNDYVLIFQKPGKCENDVRSILHDKNPGGWVTQDEWIRDAHGIWTDIRNPDVLDVAHTREADQEKHVCPLQLGVIRRLVNLYTNPVRVQPDATVLDPFMGVGSTAHVCLCGHSQDGPLAEPRNVVGFELKESYHRTALSNTRKALESLKKVDAVPAGTTLFD